MKLLLIIFALFISLSLSAQNTFQLSELTVHFQTSKNGSYFVSVNSTLLKATGHNVNTKRTTDIYTNDSQEFRAIYLKSCTECPPSYFVFYSNNSIRMWELKDTTGKNGFTYSEIENAGELIKIIK